jgi:hypothetical protein
MWRLTRQRGRNRSQPRLQTGHPVFGSEPLGKCAGGANRPLKLFQADAVLDQACVALVVEMFGDVLVCV